MANVVREFVEGIGIANSFPANPLYFTQIAIPEVVVIPDQKPDMEQLLSVMVDTNVKSIRAIETPIGFSNEGQNLTGTKISIELELRQKIKYVADEPTQSVHAAHFDKIVSSIFVVVPPVMCGEPVGNLITQGRLIVTPYIEDIYGEQLDKRRVFKNITVLIDVTCR